MGAGKGAGSSQGTSSFSPPSWMLQAGQAAVNQALPLSRAPFPIPQQPIAGINPFQVQAMSNVADIAGIGPGANMAQPFIDTGASMAAEGWQPFANASSQLAAQGSQPNIGQYYGAESAGVVPQLENIFGQQTAQQIGNLTQQAGGPTADRIGVGLANLANQQGLAAGQTLSGLMGQSVSQALQGGQLQEQAAGQMGNLAQLPLQAGQAVAQMGPQSQQSALQAQQAMLGAGSMQQQQLQNQINAAYENVLQQISWPYQTTSYLGSMAAGLAPGMGGMGITSGNTKNSMLNTGGLGSNGLTALGQGKGVAEGGRINDEMAAGGAIHYNPFAKGGRAEKWNDFDLSSATDEQRAAIRSNIMGRILPAVKLRRDNRVLVGKRGQWHHDIGATHGVDVPLYRRGKEIESGGPYQRGFVDPTDRRFYDAYDLGVDAHELTPPHQSAMAQFHGGEDHSNWGTGYGPGGAAKGWDLDEPYSYKPNPQVSQHVLPADNRRLALNPAAGEYTRALYNAEGKKKTPHPGAITKAVQAIEAGHGNIPSYKPIRQPSYHPSLFGSHDILEPVHNGPSPQMMEMRANSPYKKYAEPHTPFTRQGTEEPVMFSHLPWQNSPNMNPWQGHLRNDQGPIPWDINSAPNMPWNKDIASSSQRPPRFPHGPTHEPSSNWHTATDASEQTDYDDVHGSELFDRILPAIKVQANGKYLIGRRGDRHQDVAEQHGINIPYHRGSDPHTDRIYERGFVDPLTHRFYSGHNFPIDSTELGDRMNEFRHSGSYARGGWVERGMNDISGPQELKDIKGRMLPAIRMLSDKQMFIGKRGDWHSHIADRFGVVGGDTDAHRDKGNVSYERGFVDPMKHTFYRANSLGIDAAELQPHDPIREMHQGQTFADGGWTVNEMGQTPSHGYMVSLPGHTQILPKASTSPFERTSYTQNNSELLHQPGNYFGGWQDKGKTYFDVSRNIPTRTEAMRQAHKGHQLAIYDLAHHRSIPARAEGGGVADPGKGVPGGQGGSNSMGALGAAAGPLSSIGRMIAGAIPVPMDDGGVPDEQQITASIPLEGLKNILGGKKGAPKQYSGPAISPQIVGDPQTGIATPFQLSPTTQWPPQGWANAEIPSIGEIHAEQAQDLAAGKAAQPMSSSGGKGKASGGRVSHDPHELSGLLDALYGVQRKYLADGGAADDDDQSEWKPADPKKKPSDSQKPLSANETQGSPASYGRPLGVPDIKGQTSPAMQKVMGYKPPTAPDPWSTGGDQAGAQSSQSKSQSQTQSSQSPDQYNVDPSFGGVGSQPYASGGRRHMAGGGSGGGVGGGGDVGGFTGGGPGSEGLGFQMAGGLGGLGMMSGLSDGTFGGGTLGGPFDAINASFNNAIGQHGWITPYAPTSITPPTMPNIPRPAPWQWPTVQNNNAVQPLPAAMPERSIAPTPFSSTPGGNQPGGAEPSGFQGVTIALPSISSMLGQQEDQTPFSSPTAQLSSPTEQQDLAAANQAAVQQGFMNPDGTPGKGVTMTSTPLGAPEDTSVSAPPSGLTTGFATVGPQSDAAIAGTVSGPLGGGYGVGFGPSGFFGTPAPASISEAGPVGTIAPGLQGVLGFGPTSAVPGVMTGPLGPNGPLGPSSQSNPVSVFGSPSPQSSISPSAISDAIAAMMGVSPAEAATNPAAVQGKDTGFFGVPSNVNEDVTGTLANAPQSAFAEPAASPTLAPNSVVDSIQTTFGPFGPISAQSLQDSLSSMFGITPADAKGTPMGPMMGPEGPFGTPNTGPFGTVQANDPAFNAPNGIVGVPSPQALFNTVDPNDPAFEQTGFVGVPSAVQNSLTPEAQQAAYEAAVSGILGHQFGQNQEAPLGAPDMSNTALGQLANAYGDISGSPTGFSDNGFGFSPNAGFNAAVAASESAPAGYAGGYSDSGFGPNGDMGGFSGPSGFSDSGFGNNSSDTSGLSGAAVSDAAASNAVGDVAASQADAQQAADAAAAAAADSPAAGFGVDSSGSPADSSSGADAGVGDGSSGDGGGDGGGGKAIGGRIGGYRFGGHIHGPWANNNPFSRGGAAHMDVGGNPPSLMGATGLPNTSQENMPSLAQTGYYGMANNLFQTQPNNNPSAALGMAGTQEQMPQQQQAQAQPTPFSQPQQMQRPQMPQQQAAGQPVSSPSLTPFSSAPQPQTPPADPRMSQIPVQTATGDIAYASKKDLRPIHPEDAAHQSAIEKVQKVAGISTPAQDRANASKLNRVKDAVDKSQVAPQYDQRYGFGGPKVQPPQQKIPEQSKPRPNKSGAQLLPNVPVTSDNRPQSGAQLLPNVPVTSDNRPAPKYRLLAYDAPNRGSNQPVAERQADPETYTAHTRSGDWPIGGAGPYFTNRDRAAQFWMTMGTGNPMAYLQYKKAMMDYADRTYAMERKRGTRPPTGAELAEEAPMRLQSWQRHTPETEGNAAAAGTFAPQGEMQATPAGEINASPQASVSPSTPATTMPNTATAVAQRQMPHQQFARPAVAAGAAGALQNMVNDHRMDAMMFDQLAADIDIARMTGDSAKGQKAMADMREIRARRQQLIAQAASTNATEHQDKLLGLERTWNEDRQAWDFTDMLDPLHSTYSIPYKNIPKVGGSVQPPSIERQTGAQLPTYTQPSPSPTASSPVAPFQQQQGDVIQQGANATARPSQHQAPQPQNEIYGPASVFNWGPLGRVSPPTDIDAVVQRNNNQVGSPLALKQAADDLEHAGRANQIATLTDQTAKMLDGAIIGSQKGLFAPGEHSEWRLGLYNSATSWANILHDVKGVDSLKGFIDRFADPNAAIRLEEIGQFTRQLGSLIARSEMGTTVGRINPMMINALGQMRVKDDGDPVALLARVGNVQAVARYAQDYFHDMEAVHVHPDALPKMGHLTFDEEFKRAHRFEAYNDAGHLAGAVDENWNHLTPKEMYQVHKYGTPEDAVALARKYHLEGTGVIERAMPHLREGMKNVRLKKPEATSPDVEDQKAIPRGWGPASRFDMP